MKKLIGLTVFLMLLMASSAWAVVGTITGTATRIADPFTHDLKFVKVTLTCTAGTLAEDGTYPATVINSLISYNLVGLSLYTAGAYPGVTAPTDGTDVTITQDTIDILNGKGVNLVDATTTTITWAGSSSHDFPVPITGNITINITNNSVTSAVTTIILIFGSQS